MIFRFRKKLHRISPQKKEMARTLVENRLSFFNKIYKFKINRVAIKNTTTRWGSCSSKKNLNFNYKIIYLRSDLANYLIVHELCHLSELNHSKKFWALVSQTIPNYAKINKELKKIHIRLI
jgi:predicted metal-dependent hydrolase